MTLGTSLLGDMLIKNPGFGRIILVCNTIVSYFNKILIQDVGHGREIFLVGLFIFVLFVCINLGRDITPFSAFSSI